MAWMQPKQSSCFQQGVITLRAVLLLFVGTLLLLLLLGSVSVSFDRFRDYVADQLEGHAQDAAVAIGLSLSNAIDGRDPVAAGSLIDAAFDSGRYLSITYLDNDGNEIAGRMVPLSGTGVPDWFIQLADLPLPKGEAEVIRGWNRLGQVVVVSHPGRAYRDIWQVTLQIVIGIAVLGGVGLVSLYWLMARILRPLREVEIQAEALGRRDFRRRVEVTSTRELNRVTRVMNQMASDLGRLFEGQARLIQHLRRVNNEDRITGLSSANAFDQRLKADVESEERSATGVLMLLHLADFSHYNQAYGRKEADRALVRIAEAIDFFVKSHAGAYAGRRTGAEFSVFLPGVSQADASVWCAELVEHLDGLYADLAAPLDTAVHGGIAQTAEGAGLRELMAAADGALRQAQTRENSCCSGADTAQKTHFNMETWRTIIMEAIRRDEVSLWLQPMVEPVSGKPLYHQVFSRIRSDGEWIRAGTFVPMAERFGLTPEIDLLIVERTLALLREDDQRQLAISLGAVSVASEVFRHNLQEALERAGPTRNRLWVGISEQTIHHHRTAVGLLVRALNRIGVWVMVDRFGVGGVPFSYLKNLRLQALRIDNTFIHNIDSHAENRFYLESVVDIARSRGVKVFVSGVETAREYSVLAALGIDGAMGYHLGRPYPAEDGIMGPG